MNIQKTTEARVRVAVLLLAAVSLFVLAGCGTDAPFGTTITVEAFGVPVVLNPVTTPTVTATTTKTQSYRVVVADSAGLPLNDIDVHFLGQFTNGQFITFGSALGSAPVTLATIKKNGKFGYLDFSITVPFYAIGQQISFPRNQTGTSSITGGFLPDGTYSYIITSVDLAGESDYGGSFSIPVTGATDTVTGTSTGSTQLSWTSVAGATDYNVYGASAAFPVFGYLFTIECPPAGCTGTVTGTDDGTTWPPGGGLPPVGTNTTGLGPNSIKGTMQVTSGSALASQTIDF